MRSGNVSVPAQTSCLDLFWASLIQKSGSFGVLKVWLGILSSGCGDNSSNSNFQEKKIKAGTEDEKVVSSVFVLYCVFSHILRNSRSNSAESAADQDAFFSCR